MSPRTLTGTVFIIYVLAGFFGTPATAESPRAQRPVVPLRQCLYVLAEDGTIHQFHVTTTGVLTPLSPPTVDSGQFVWQFVVAPGGHSAYVASETPPGIWQFGIGHDGALTPLAPPLVGVPESLHIDINKDGRFAYSLSPAHTAVHQFRIAADGTLHSLAPPTVPIASAAWSVSLAPDGRHAYVVDRAGIEQFRIGADGALLRAPGPAFPAPARMAPGLYFPPQLPHLCWLFTWAQIERLSIAADGSLHKPPDPPQRFGTRIGGY